MAEVRMEKVLRRFGKVKAVDNIDLVVKDGEFMVFLGPSGCGKTTTLRCVAGLERVDAGKIFIGHKEVTSLPPGRRGIGMVFQSYALFPHMTVFENIAFGLRIKRVPKDQTRAKVARVAELLQLGEMLSRYPSQLSGGQRQRVAVARCLVVEPEVLLMDEPLSNLDALLRLQMRAELKRLHNEIQATTIYVAHDQIEALSLGDRIAVMKNGTIIQCDIPIRIYDKPANVFVGSFIGNPPMNFLRGALTRESGRTVVRGEEFEFCLPPETASLLHGYKEVTVGIRPENIEISHDLPAQDRGVAHAEVIVVELLGNQKLLSIEMAGSLLKVATEPDFPVSPGDQVWLCWKEEKVCFFDPETDWAVTAKREAIQD